MRYLIFFFISFSAYASLNELKAELENCWNKSDKLMSQVKPDDMGDDFGDPFYQKKKTNDSKCYSLQKDIEKKYKREYACFYQHQTKSRKCKESIGGWK